MESLRSLLWGNTPRDAGLRGMLLFSLLTLFGLYLSFEMIHSCSPTSQPWRVCYEVDGELYLEYQAFGQDITANRLVNVTTECGKIRDCQLSPCRSDRTIPQLGNTYYCYHPPTGSKPGKMLLTEHYFPITPRPLTLFSGIGIVMFGISLPLVGIFGVSLLSGRYSEPQK